MRTRHRTRARRGFSLPELLISMVMVGMIGLVLTRLIVNESRTNNRQVLQRGARGVSRGALNIMMAELRMAEQSTAFSAVTAGNAPAPSGTSLAVNVPWAIGVRCTPTEALMMPTDSLIGWIGRQYNRGVGVRDASSDEYDIMTNIAVTPHGNTALCNVAGINASGAGAMPGMTPFTVASAMGGGLGTPVMFYYQVRYTFKASTSVPGRIGLFRQVFSWSGSEPEEELVAPFNAGSGFQYYRGTNRMPGAAPAPTEANLRDISGVQLNLIGESERNAQGRANPEAANLSTAIFFRNRM